MMLHNGQDTVIRLNLFEAVKKTNEGEVNLKICGNLDVNKTYTDGHIRRLLGLLV